MCRTTLSPSALYTLPDTCRLHPSAIMGNPLSALFLYILKALHPVQEGPNKVVFQQPAPLWLHLPRHAGSYTSKRRSCKQYSYSIHIFH